MISKDLLSHIDPDDYQCWISVGMALKHEGNPVSDWVDWSRGSEKFREGECERKWESFREESGGDPVTGGTVYHMAVENGYVPGGDGLLHIGDVIEDVADMYKPVTNDYRIVDPTLERESLPAFDPKTYDPLADMVRYLRGLFDDDDVVGYCNKIGVTADGRQFPEEYRNDETAGHILSVLERKDRFGGIKFAVGSTVNENGMYVRFNPLDGRGGGNANVTRRTYCLVECDDPDTPPEKQYALLRAMRLPWKFLVHSGNRSIHAIVHVDAASQQEYRDRVRFVYDFCRRNGLKVDEQDKNESRYSRLPGIRRGDRWQYVIADDSQCEFRSYDAWREWVDERNENLPDALTLADVWDDMPPLAPELIPGVLREGHKMLLAAPSKAGKSFALQELAIDIAEGRDWMGFGRCAQGRVLYVNMELDPNSCAHRFRDLYEAMGIGRPRLENVSIWNLRGHSTPLDKLAPIMARRFKDGGYKAVILDPIYKVMVGDENAAGDMAAMCNWFDRIIAELGCALVYCHHFSKGAGRTYANAADMPSGSGVFARDPDAILAMRELRLSEFEEGNWRDKMGSDSGSLTAWEVSSTLREFPTPGPRRVMFDWPLHVTDSLNLLAKCRYADTAKGSGVGKDQAEREESERALSDQMSMLTSVSGDTAVRSDDLMRLLGWSESKLCHTSNTGPGTPWERATIEDGTNVVHPRGENVLTYGSERYVRPKSKSGEWKARGGRWTRLQ